MIKRKSMTSIVVQTIMDDIKQGTLQPGAKLDNEFVLAEKFGVGRGTIREAIKILISRNIVEIKRGSGTFVKENPGVMDDPLGLQFDEDKFKSAMDICEFRLLVEPAMAKMAAIRATYEDIDAIQKTCKVCAESIQAGHFYAKEDIAFHEAIAKASHNEALIKLIPILHSGVLELINKTKRKLLTMTLETHQAIADAIVSHNEEEAYRAMKTHILANQKYLEEILSKKKK